MDRVLTDKAISLTPKRMGRESLGVVGVYVWLFGGQRERIDALVGKQARSDFIRKAIEAELKRRERRKP